MSFFHSLKGKERLKFGACLMEKTMIAVLAGDKRTLYMAEELEKKGYSVWYCGRQENHRDCIGIAESHTDCCSMAEKDRKALEGARAIVGGIPFLDEEKVFSYLQSDQLFFGGMLSEAFIKKCRQKGVSCFDFMKEESIAVYNAIATAEGAIMAAIREKETNLHGSQCLVCGYGRCGKVLCSKLKGLAAQVTAASRDEEELAWADALGMDTIKLSALSGKIQKYDYIFNTIPKMILQKPLLEKTGKEVLILDIASGEGGINYEEANKLERKVLHLLGIPGKVAPKASAQRLADYIVEKL